MARGEGFVIIGLGTFGTTVATELARAGEHVLGIDRHERHVARVADELSEAIIADARDEDALREAGVGAYATVIVGIGEDLEASLLATMNARLLGVKRVWVKAKTRTHHRILLKIGADRVILPEQEIGRHAAQVLRNPQVRDYVSLGNGFHVVEYVASEDMDGWTLDRLKLDDYQDLRALGLMRGTEFVPCTSPETELKAEDKLLLLGRREDFRRFGDVL
ncbi:potassium channel family protein [Albimonas pacifica]|uniref:Trk system potassium uptake protein TrkA n=1 Tax=Albimonas pacifica TaxID=1114924 RepID=A0A1I3LZV9_9RHOB|nr:TrkA family potassium uptake protein [Albimonas pacifica]SFI90070.1 trk system potassium uptake protein TrkA [Albimonas pacifica]